MGILSISIYIKIQFIENGKNLPQNIGSGQGFLNVKVHEYISICTKTLSFPKLGEHTVLAEEKKIGGCTISATINILLNVIALFYLCLFRQGVPHMLIFQWFFSRHSYKNTVLSQVDK